MKKVDVTSCSHSQGWPMVRVTMSNITEVEKPSRVSPQRTISTDSSPSSARHFRWRWRCRTRRLATPMRVPFARCLLDRPNQLLDLDRVRAELLGEFVEIGSGNLDEARLVDVAHDLDADRLELLF